MKFEIRSVRNGAVLTIDHDLPGEPPEEIVYQATDHGEIEAFADFLRYLLDHYGPASSRYSPKRIHITMEPGDKYVGPAEGTDN